MSGRAILGAILMVIVTIALISVASSGVFRSIPDMPLRRKLLSLGGVCLVTVFIALYLHGDIDYLIWLHGVPSRPADEIAFVDHVHSVQATQSAEHDSAARSAMCRKETTAITQAASSVEDWGGTVSTTYAIGAKVALVVRIGRFVQLRTSYNDEDMSVLIDRNSPIYDDASTLQSGQAVIVSGSSMPQPKGCLLASPGTDASDDVEVLFRFTKLKVVKG